jgi:hypothetical protein
MRVGMIGFGWMVRGGDRYRRGGEGIGGGGGASRHAWRHGHGDGKGSEAEEEGGWRGRERRARPPPACSAAMLSPPPPILFFGGLVKRILNYFCFNGVCFKSNSSCTIVVNVSS